MLPFCRHIPPHHAAPGRPADLFSLLAGASVVWRLRSRVRSLACRGSLGMAYTEAPRLPVRVRLTRTAPGAALCHAPILVVVLYCRPAHRLRIPPAFTPRSVPRTCRACPARDMPGCLRVYFNMPRGCHLTLPQRAPYAAATCYAHKAYRWPASRLPTFTLTAVLLPACRLLLAGCLPACQPAHPLYLLCPFTACHLPAVRAGLPAC